MIHTLTDKAIAVELPDNATQIDIDEDGLFYRIPMPGFIIPIGHWKKLPRYFDDWQILGRPKDLTGVEILSLIEKELDASNKWWYKNYIIGGEDTKDFRASYDSLLQSKGLTRESSVIILINIK